MSKRKDIAQIRSSNILAKKPDDSTHRNRSAKRLSALVATPRKDSFEKSRPSPFIDQTNVENGSFIPSTSWSGALTQSVGPLTTSGGGPLGFKNVALGYRREQSDFRDNDVIDFERALRSRVVSGLKEKKDATLTKRASSLSGKSLEGTLSKKEPRFYHLGDVYPGELSPVEDQGSVGSCTANAVIGIVEFLMRREGDATDDLSRMFLYKVTRNLLGWSGDTGAYIRTTIKAMRLFGAPSESEWIYDPALLDVEPEAYHYSFAQNYKSMSYYKLDGEVLSFDRKNPAQKQTQSSTIGNIKKCLLWGFPVAFGFSVYRSLMSVNIDNPVIPTPIISNDGRERDILQGGHAVCIVGYNDDVDYKYKVFNERDVESLVDPADQDKGAFIIRNSWGTDWGDLGYAYLPYAYFNYGWASDFWTILDQKFVDLKIFE